MKSVFLLLLLTTGKTADIVRVKCFHSGTSCRSEQQYSYRICLPWIMEGRSLGLFLMCKSNTRIRQKDGKRGSIRGSLEDNFVMMKKLSQDWKKYFIKKGNLDKKDRLICDNKVKKKENSTELLMKTRLWIYFDKLLFRISLPIQIHNSKEILFLISCNPT